MTRSNLKKEKDEAKILWLKATANELENTMNADPRTVWKAYKKIAAGLFGHHKSTVLMKIREQNGNYCNNNLENVEMFKYHFLILYNNHDGTKYVETISNEIHEQPKDSLLGNQLREFFMKAPAKMPYEKNSGLNGISTEAFKNLGSISNFLVHKNIEILA